MILDWHKRHTTAIAALIAMGGLVAAPAVAQETPAKEAAPVEEAPAAEEGPSYWTLQDNSPLGSALDPFGIKVYGHIAQGFTFNPDAPRDRQNFGRVFDDRSNDYRLNQILLTLERPLEFKDGESGWGFKTQYMYGSDARFTRSLGIADNMDNNSVTFDIVEAFGVYHAPVLTEGGVDIKAGVFVTLMGAEVIDAKGNPLYSHSYIFNFGIPLKHSGFMATVHVNENLDLMGGLVTGINTGIDDNNDYHAFHGGISTKWLDGKVLNFTSIHAGPENDEAYGNDASSDARVIISNVTTVQWNDGFKTITDFVWGKDDGGLGQPYNGGTDAEWYGIAQYAIFNLCPNADLVFRGEVFRDDDGFAVFQFAENDDLIDFQRGSPAANIDRRTVGGGDTTYWALTAGLNLKPKDNILIRPEIRWDWADGPGGPFDDSSDSESFTAGFDIIFSF